MTSVVVGVEADEVAVEDAEQDLASDRQYAVLTLRSGFPTQIENSAHR